MNELGYSRITAEGDLKMLRRAAELVLASAEVRVLSDPGGAMVMIRHVDPLEMTPFYLGEVYVTECEVEVDGVLGYGCAIGNEDERALYGAIIDGVMIQDHPLKGQVEDIVEKTGKKLAERWAEESRRVASTKVDFEVR